MMRYEPCTQLSHTNKMLMVQTDSPSVAGLGAGRPEGSRYSRRYFRRGQLVLMDRVQVPGSVHGKPTWSTSPVLLLLQALILLCMLQVIMAILIFSLLGSVAPEDGRTRSDEIRNGLFSTIAFVLGAITSILSGFLGMKIATYANARTALEARKGIAPAFMCGKFLRRP